MYQYQFTGWNRYNILLFIAPCKIEIAGNTKIKPIAAAHRITSIQPAICSVFSLGSPGTGCYSIFDPALRQDPFSESDTILQVKQAKACPVSGSCIRKRRAHKIAGCIWLETISDMPGNVNYLKKVQSNLVAKLFVFVSSEIPTDLFY